MAKPEPDEELTIDELARQTGMTVRNVRAHQSRGLLPPPQVRGRTGFYGPEHIARLELIKELQNDGFNLEGIRKLIENAGGSTEQVLRFTREVREAFEEEQPEIVELAELADRFGEGADGRLLARAVKLGLLRPLGDDRYEERSPRLGRAAGQLAELGIDPARAIQVMETLHRSADGVAKAYVKLFLDEIWSPFEEAGSPPERWHEVQDGLDRLRPLAAETLLAMFGLVMSERIDRTVDEVLARTAEGSGRAKSRRGK